MDWATLGTKALEGVSTQFGWFVACLLLAVIGLAWQNNQNRSRLDKIIDQMRKDDRQDFERVIGVIVTQTEKSAEATHASNNVTNAVSGLAVIISNLKDAIYSLKEKIG